MEHVKLPVIYTCFPGGKHKALTMSYDDGKTEDRRLIEIFNEYGIKGTFNINGGFLTPELTEKYGRIPVGEFEKLYEGHEIASHTYTHPTIGRSPIEQVVQQVIEDRKSLEAVTGAPVRGLAYPNGSYSQTIKEVLPSLGIRYARVVGNTDNFQMPGDYYEWKATCHHNHNLLELGEKFVALHKTQYLYLMYVWGHSYEFSMQNNWDLIEKFCRLAGRKEDTWYATNIQIADYMDAAERLQYAADGSFVFNPSAQTVWISVHEAIQELPGGCLTKLL